MKKLIPLIIMIVLGNFSRSYSQTQQVGDSINVALSDYKNNLEKLSDCILGFKTLKELKEDTLALHKEIVRKEQVIQKLIEQRNRYKNLIDSLDKLIEGKNQIIKAEENTIKLLGRKPKTFAIGPFVGYGIDTNLKPHPVIGICLTKTFIRF